MKRVSWIVALAIVASAAAIAVAQQKSLAATLNVYVFPKEGQDSSQQSKDESTCYDWAVSQTGSDPFQLQKQAQQEQQQGQQKQAQADAQKQQAQQAGQGAGARGAVGGAAMGALIGEIASDDAGKGAAYGAAAGMLVARRRAREKQAEATSQTNQQAQQAQQQTDQALAANAAQQDNFKKAFSACLEAKDYMVKY